MIDIFCMILTFLVAIFIIIAVYVGFFLIIYFIIGFFIHGTLQVAISLMLTFMIFIMGRV